MQENDNIKDTPIVDLDQAREKLSELGQSAQQKAEEYVDTEKIGKHARNLRDRAELFVRDNKVEIGAAVVFIAGVWVGRRGVRKAVAKALNSEEARTTFIDLFGFEPDSRHIVLPPVELEKVKKMAKTGRTMSIQGQGLILTLSAAKN